MVPESILSKIFHPRLMMRDLFSKEQIRKSNLSLYRRSAQQEEGLRTAFIGGIIVNLLYCLHTIFFIYFTKYTTKSTKKNLTAVFLSLCWLKEKSFCIVELPLATLIMFMPKKISTFIFALSHCHFLFFPIQWRLRYPSVSSKSP